MLNAAEHEIPGYNGLTERVDGLPAHWYFEPQHFEREMQRIWFRNWIYLGRSSELPGPRAFRTYEIGDQSLLLLRADDGALHGFHNTCRHRGAALCRESEGVLRSGAIVCPYHAWTYSLQGRLLRTSSKALPKGFQSGDFSLYAIQVREWNGFVFVALCKDPPAFEALFDLPLSRFDAWGLQGLTVGHEFTKTIRSNWKIFWENYNECLHCPGVHPMLSNLVPIYGRGLLDERDDPHWRTNADDRDPKYKGGLRAGASSWSMDGQASAAPFPGLSDEDRRSGAVYLTGYPSFFIVGHIDYVRVVRLRPLGPEETELRIEYLFSPQTLTDPGFDLKNIVEFTNRVMSEDASVCELNQRGLRAAPHACGVVMPEEYVVHHFHQWIHSEMARA